ISHDPSLRATVPLADGRALTGLDLLEVHLEAAEQAATSGHEDWVEDAEIAGTGPATTDVLTRWRSVLDVLRADPAGAAGQVEWVAKHALLQRFRERAGVGWDDPRVAAMDIQWHDLDPSRGLAQKLRAAGRL